MNQFESKSQQKDFDTGFVRVFNVPVFLKPMQVLGIDPGPKESAFVHWNGEMIIGANVVSNEDLRSHLSKNLKGEIIVAVEHLQCMGMAVGASVFETAYWIGEFRGLVAFELGLRFVRVFRGEVKMYFCQSMRAKDANIRQALIDRFGSKGTKRAPGLTYGLKADLWSAFAIAVMVYDKKYESRTENTLP